MTFMSVWLLYAIVGVALFAATFLWAVRTRQFSDLDRARYIALRAEAEDSDRGDPRPSFADRYVWIAIGIAFIGALCCVAWAGWGR